METFIGGKVYNTYWRNYKIHKNYRLISNSCDIIQLSKVLHDSVIRGLKTKICSTKGLELYAIAYKDGGIWIFLDFRHFYKLASFYRLYLQQIKRILHFWCERGPERRVQIELPDTFDVLRKCSTDFDS